MILVDSSVWIDFFRGTVTPQVDALDRLCCRIRHAVVMSPLMFCSLPDGLREGDSERCEAIEYGDTDVNFRDLTVEVPCRQALTEKFDAMHFRLDTASSMITAPSFPDGPTEMPTDPQSFIAGDGPR